jgi:hypothetical protein
MPRLTKSLPKYRKHRASGQAVVTLDAVDFYLGPHGSKASRLEYDRLIAEWLANGRRMPAKDSEGHLAIVEVLIAYKRHAEVYYVKNGEATGEVAPILSAMRIVKRLYSKLPAEEFGPLKLQAVQQAMIAEGWSRKSINRQISRVVRMFSWAEAKEMVPKGHTAALREVPGLHQGRTNARETGLPIPSTPLGGRPSRRFSLTQFVDETPANQANSVGSVISDSQNALAKRLNEQYGQQLKALVPPRQCEHDYPAAAMNIDGRQVHCPGCGAFVGFVDEYDLEPMEAEQANQGGDHESEEAGQRSTSERAKGGGYIETI